MSQTLTLSRGDPKICGQVKVMYRKCRKSCKYKAGKWGKCDKLANIKQRTDTLKENSEGYCKSTRIITKNVQEKRMKKLRKQRRNKENKTRIKNVFMREKENGVNVIQRQTKEQKQKN